MPPPPRRHDILVSTHSASSALHRRRGVIESMLVFVSCEDELPFRDLPTLRVRTPSGPTYSNSGPRILLACWSSHPGSACVSLAGRGVLRRRTSFGRSALSSFASHPLRPPIRILRGACVSLASIRSSRRIEPHPCPNRLRRRLVQRASNSHPRFIQHVAVNHHRAYMRVASKLLHGADAS